jgi:hypothetical protein
MANAPGDGRNGAYITPVARLNKALNYERIRLPALPNGVITSQEFKVKCAWTVSDCPCMPRQRHDEKTSRPMV